MLGFFFRSVVLTRVGWIQRMYSFFVFSLAFLEGLTPSSGNANSSSSAFANIIQSGCIVFILHFCRGMDLATAGRSIRWAPYYRPRTSDHSHTCLAVHIEIKWKMSHALDYG
ncbi:hypothetical protein BJX62DRAFT_45800 [Aspergillus germanicus]